MGFCFIGMDIADGDSVLHCSTTSCKCYKASGLTRTILDSNEISNFTDQYSLGEQLGWGQFGVIRACSDKSTGEVLACKSIAKDRLVMWDDVSSVKLEIEIMTRLSGHPNVVNLKAVYEEDDYVHLLMELCAGGELFHWLEKNGSFSEHNARVIFRYLMQVVEYCHVNGIVHRDLKPENILLATRSSSSPIKLADFGLATYIRPGKNLHGTVGSPFYIAPEVLAGGYNQAADVWSTGVILYILLSGMPPFWGKTKSKIFDAVRAADLQFPPDPWDQISASAKELITGMLCKDPSKRLTAAQVLAHSWMEDCAQESCKEDNFYCDQPQEMHEGSYSTPHFTRDQDYSFSDGSPVTTDGQPWQAPIFTSSFSSFRVDNSSPYSASRDFSFSNGGESSPVEFLSPIPSMFSFTFFSSNSKVDEGDISSGLENTESKRDAVQGEPVSGKLFVVPDFSLPLKHRGGDLMLKADLQREGISGSKVSSIHGRRNHTIGLGELDQLNTVVTESVIRWASCTQIPTASSLRLSLVC